MTDSKAWLSREVETRTIIRTHGVSHLLPTINLQAKTPFHSPLPLSRCYLVACDAPSLLLADSSRCLSNPRVRVQVNIV